jgi:hypothetical protein
LKGSQTLKKFVIGILSIAVLAILLVGCVGTGDSVGVMPQSQIDADVQSVASSTVWGVANGTVVISNYQPGDTAYGVLVLHNGNAGQDTFYLSSESPYALMNVPPQTTTTTTVTPTLVAVQSYQVTMNPMETVVIPVTFRMPKNVAFNKNYKFNIDVTDNQSSFINPGYQQEWKVY